MKLGLGLSLSSMQRRRDTPAFDPDALAYIAAVETADGEALEAGVKTAINDFVVGCKDDGIWDALKASCILAGARTLNGCLVPLTGAAPTNFNFVSADYNRKTGLRGDGSTKHLDSNRANNADPQNSIHISVFVSVGATSNARRYLGDLSAETELNPTTSGEGGVIFRSRVISPNFISTGGIGVAGFIGSSRAASTEFTARIGGANTVTSATSTAPNGNSNFGVFSRGGDGSFQSEARLSFYSIGESIDLAALDARVSALMTAIDGAIA